MLRKWGMALALAAAAATTAAAADGGVAQVRKQAVASMVLTGNVEIDAGGRVVAHSIDRAAEVAPVVVELMNKAVPTWRFQPVLVDGKAVPARSQMRVRVVARAQDDGNYAVTFRDADFPGDPPAPGTYPTGKRMVPPVYPASALRAGAGAAVYVAARIAPDGTVEDAVAEQVNLPFVAPERTMDAARKLFADAAVKAAKASKFNPPTKGEGVGKASSMRIPYEFNVGNGAAAGYGQWVTYVPGPYHPAPWRVGELIGAPDLVVTGDGAQPTDRAGGLRLHTALGDGG